MLDQIRPHGLGGGADTFDNRRGEVDGDILGGEGSDRIMGGASDERMDGGAGRDILKGGAGEDTFIFSNSAASLLDADIIKDFGHTDDVFELQFFAAVRHVGSLLANEFTLIDKATSNKGVDADDRVLYHKAEGAIYFDQDGSATKYDRVLLAYVDPKTSLDYTDFEYALSFS